MHMYSTQCTLKSLKYPQMILTRTPHHYIQLLYGVPVNWRVGVSPIPRLYGCVYLEIAIMNSYKYILCILAAYSYIMQNKEFSVFRTLINYYSTPCGCWVYITYYYIRRFSIQINFMWMQMCRLSTLHLLDNVCMYIVYAT